MCSARLPLTTTMLIGALAGISSAAAAAVATANSAAIAFRRKMCWLIYSPWTLSHQQEWILPALQKITRPAGWMALVKRSRVLL